jgi:short-subunit dehydrogenase
MSAETKPALIVTGASSGIGREFARVAAPEFPAVLLVARTEAALAELARELGTDGREVDFLPLDLAGAEAGAKIAARLSERGWHADVLVNNAGFGYLGPVHDMPLQPQLSIIDVNIRALAELTLRFLPDMAVRGRGGVINIGSAASFSPGPGMALYFASKAFVRSFTDAVHAEANGTGVTVTAVHPGPIATDFGRRAGVAGQRSVAYATGPTARQVAEAGWRGFREGRRQVRPGLLNKAAIVIAQMVPTGLLLAVLARLIRARRK